MVRSFLTLAAIGAGATGIVMQRNYCEANNRDTVDIAAFVFQACMYFV